MTISGLTLTGADAGNYIIVPPTTTADITAATLTVTGITASDKVYDGTTGATLDTCGATSVGSVAGDDVMLDVIVPQAHSRTPAQARRCRWAGWR